MSRRPWGAALVLAALLAGCSLPVRTVDAPLPPPAAVHERWTGCRDVVPDVELAEPNDRPDRGRVPDGFVPVAAVSCGPDWSADRAIGLERRTDDVSHLLEALAQPSEQEARRSGPVACTADAWLVPWLFLVDTDGRWLAPEIPLDVCGKPRNAAVVDSSNWPVDRRWEAENR